MSTRSFVDLGLTVVGWWMIVTLPVNVVVRTVFQTDVISDVTLVLSVCVALPLAGLHWWSGKSLRRLGDYIFSLIAYQLVFGIVALAVIATFNIELITGTVPSVLVTSGVLCLVYLSAYYRTYSGGLMHVWRDTTARSE